jgi:hypothetical protein
MYVYLEKCAGMPVQNNIGGIFPVLDAERRIFEKV